MSRRIRNAIAVGVAVLLVVSASTVFLFSAPDFPPPQPVGGAPKPFDPLPNSVPLSPATPPHSSDPTELIALFGFESTAARQPTPPHPRERTRLRADPEPKRSIPLRYVGWTNSDDARLYLFVDGDTGRIFGLALEREDDPWRMVEEGEEGFVLSDGSAEYRVARR